MFNFRQFFGEPIQCDAGSASDGIDSGVLNSYCWMYSTWNIPQTYKVVLQTKAIRRFVIMEKAPTRAFSWLKAATTAFTFKTLLRHYAKRTLTPLSLNVKLGP